MNTQQLSPRRQQFIAEYPKDLNATQAAIRAGFSKKTAREQAARLLSNVDISDAIQKQLSARLHRAEVTADRVLAELARLAFSDLASFYRPDGSIKAFKDLTEDQRACLAGAETLIKNAKAGDGVTDTVLRIKLHDKVKALEMLAKYFGILTEKVAHSGAIVIRWMDEPQ